MLYSDDSRAMREALRRFDNRKNGFGDIASGTSQNFRSFADKAALNPDGYPETLVKEADGTPWSPHNSDGSPKLVIGLDIPPLE